MTYISENYDGGDPFSEEIGGIFDMLDMWQEQSAWDVQNYTNRVNEEIANMNAELEEFGGASDSSLVKAIQDLREEFKDLQKDFAEFKQAVHREMANASLPTGNLPGDSTTTDDTGGAV